MIKINVTHCRARDRRLFHQYGEPLRWRRDEPCFGLFPRAEQGRNQSYPPLAAAGEGAAAGWLVAAAAASSFRLFVLCCHRRCCRTNIPSIPHHRSPPASASSEGQLSSRYPLTNLRSLNLKTRRVGCMYALLLSNTSCFFMCRVENGCGRIRTCIEHES